MKRFCFEFLIILKSNFLTLLGLSLVYSILCQQVVLVLDLKLTCNPKPV